MQGWIVGAVVEELEFVAQVLGQGLLLLVDGPLPCLLRFRTGFRAGEAWGELASSLSAADAEAAQVREAWAESAAAYTRAGAEEEGAASRAKGSDEDFAKTVSYVVRRTSRL
ncbi:hypothetical protein ACFQ9J_32015 [Streptomyces sp. NPDC056529]|uniref:hypothetical protein n=1 Tax=Streptomyces sp. NPDC056529 TaxID=3345855 RepID=UPI0036A6EE8B